MATEPSRAEANRLYWETDAPVGRIAETLGISRRALYELLERIPAEGPCPECGGPILFANRLARSTGEAQCGACGASTVVAAIRPRSPDARLASAAAEAAANGGNGVGRAVEEGIYPPWTYAPQAPRRGLKALLTDRRVLTVAGVALAGVLVGVCATVLIRRRRRR